MHYAAYKVCAAHLAPAYLDTEATVERAASAIAEAAHHGARLIAFPESYVPGFPVWAALHPPIHNHELFKRLAACAIEVQSPIMRRLQEAAQQHSIFVSIGFTEGTKTSVGCLWNSNVLIDDRGAIINHHRKLVPTFYEKLIWANGDGAGLRVVETSLGRLGMLICGENTNPLARYTLMAQGEQVHVSSYPPAWPTRDPRSGDNYDLEQAIRIRAGAHAFEAKSFNIVASAYLDERAIEVAAQDDAEATRILRDSPRGVSMVIGPTGEVISDVVSNRECLLYADIDISRCVEPKQFHDVVGYYNRFDIFKLTVNTSANRPIVFEAVAEKQAREPSDEAREEEAIAKERERPASD